jgi:5-methylthioadenosine/S-adenosylhomocysteine deaminase
LLRIALAIECNAHHTELGKSSDELVQTGYELARERNLRVPVHVSGGTLSMSMGFLKYLRLTGRRDVAYLDRLGVLDHRWLLKHGIHFSDTDIGTVKARGAHVVYTPTSESMRGGGLGPFAKLHRAGVNCALGSDGPAVDYSIDMVEQLKACVYLQNAKHRDVAAMTPEIALDMATRNAATALGMLDEIGSLEVGKRADIAIFDLRRPYLEIIENPLVALVCCARGADADTVMVNGRPLLRHGRFTGISDCEAICEEATKRGHALAARAGLASRAVPNWPSLTRATAP